MSHPNKESINKTILIEEIQNSDHENTEQNN